MEMDNFGSVDEALDFAIEREQEASDFYTHLAGKMERQGMSQVFRQFAREEMGHKAKLEAVKAGRTLAPADRRITDLKIGDYLVDVEPTEDMGYQQALTLAMKKEKAAFKLYSDMAAAAPSEDLETLFLGLAQEEAKHKLRFEIEYDDKVLQEN